MNSSVSLEPYKKRKTEYIFSWFILLDGKRAGHIHIGPETSRPNAADKNWITIHVNADMRGKGIGTAAYRLACEASGFREVYAHMRKSNVASRIAAEKAGFTVIEDPHASPQLALKWTKQ